MKRAAALATLLVAILALAEWLDPVREGLNGTYYANADWSDPPAVSTHDPQPSNERLLAAWRGAPPSEFSTTWAGSLLAMHDGPYALATISRRWVVRCTSTGSSSSTTAARRVWPRGATGSVTLTRGVHAIYVRYRAGRRAVSFRAALGAGGGAARADARHGR